METSLQRRSSDERGEALIEFTSVALLFFIMTFGIMEFSRMIFCYSVVSNATREGLRYASIRGSKSGHAATALEIQSFVSTKSFGIVPSGNVTVQTVDTSNTTASWPTSDDPGSSVRITAQTTFRPVAALLPQAAIVLSSTATQVIVR